MDDEDAQTPASRDTDVRGKRYPLLRRSLKWWARRSFAEKISISVPLAGVVIGGLFGLAGTVLQISVSDEEKRAPATIPLVAPSQEDADAALVDLTVIGEGENQEASVDIKLLNKGGSVAFLKAAEIRVLDARVLNSCPLPHPIESSYTYDVELPANPTQFPLSIKVPLSQAVEADDVDRFTFKLGTKGISEFTIGSTIYRMILTLEYNEGSTSRVVSSPFLAIVDYPVAFRGSTTLGIDHTPYRECIEGNIDSVRHMLQLEGYRSEHLTDLGKTMEENAEYIDAWKKDHK